VLLEESEATLQLECPELGKFLYTLALNSTQPGPERVLTFNVPLGSRDMQPFRFFHYLNDKAEYRCSFENKAQQQGFESEPSVVGHAAGT
jgi:hydrocephalus-inducing protein